MSKVSPTVCGIAKRASASADSAVAKPAGDHQRAETAVRPPPPCHQPRGDVWNADPLEQCDLDGAGVGVGQAEGERACGRGQAGERDGSEAPLRSAKRVRHPGPSRQAVHGAWPLRLRSHGTVKGRRPGNHTRAERPASMRRESRHAGVTRANSLPLVVAALLSFAVRRRQTEAERSRNGSGESDQRFPRLRVGSRSTGDREPAEDGDLRARTSWRDCPSLPRAPSATRPCGRA